MNNFKIFSLELIVKMLMQTLNYHVKIDANHTDTV